MQRTFKHHVSPAGVALTVVVACASLSFLWHRSPQGAAAGLCLMAVTVVFVERLLHTEYVFRGGSLLVVRGRFSRRVVIPVGDIVRAERVRTPLGLSRYILIEYGAGHRVAVQPDNEAAFLNEIKKRQCDE